MKQSLRVVLLCDNIIRELTGLTQLKKELEKKLSAEVYLIGSIAEIQRTYYSLYRIKPHLVFISQIMEKDCRAIAAYVRQSGGMVCVLPVEITPAKAVESVIVSPKLRYNHLLDMLFLPGQHMFSYFNKTDIDKQKMVITGSPKMDVVLASSGMSRQDFTSQQHIPSDKPNVFFFSSFPRTSLDYFRSDKCFTQNMTLMKKIHKAIRGTHQAYLKALPKICAALPRINVVFKPHPLEDLSWYDEITAPNFYLVRDASVKDCMASIDVVVHWNSTVCTECWLHQLPTLQFSPLRKYDWLLSEFSLGNPVSHTYQQLVKKILEQIHKKKQLDNKFLKYQKAYLIDNFYRVDGKSSQRITQILKKKLVKTSFNLHYTEHFHPAIRLLLFIQKILGVKLSRWLVALLTHSYN